MDDTEALIALARAFPGIMAEPRMHAGDSLEPCTRCGAVGVVDDHHIRTTVMRDDQDKPYHLHCKRRSIGLGR